MKLTLHGDAKFEDDSVLQSSNQLSTGKLTNYHSKINQLPIEIPEKTRWKYHFCYPYMSFTNWSRTKPADMASNSLLAI